MGTTTTLFTATQKTDILDLEINLKISSNGNKCPICESGKSIEECLKMNKQECGKDESCSMSVRSRGGRIESVNFECKQQNACKNEKNTKWNEMGSRSMYSCQTKRAFSLSPVLSRSKLCSKISTI